MFPEITELQFDLEETETELKPIGKSFLYDFIKGDFVFEDGKMIPLYEVDSLKMWIEKTLQTASNRFFIYEGFAYGVGIEDLIGSNLPRAYVEAEIKREVTESLELSPYIESLEGWTYERNGTLMKVFFKVISPMYNTFDMEVNI